MLNLEYAMVSAELGAGLGVFSSCTPYNSALYNNGALNPLGSVYMLPTPSQTAASTVLGSSAGYGSVLIVKYVLVKSTSNPATVAGPGLVYYTDESFTTVSPVRIAGSR